jgi:thioredoxin 1
MYMTVVAFDTPIRTSAQNLERVLATKIPALMVFENPGCENCRSLDSVLDGLARDFAGQALIVHVVDVMEGGLATRFGVKRVPTLVYWRDGREVTRIEGAAQGEALRAHLNYLLGRQPRPASAHGPSNPLTGNESVSVKSQPDHSATTETPISVTDSTFDELVLKSPLPVLVDFWAPWCGPCRMVSPIVEELGRQYSGKMRVAKINTDDNPRRAMSLGIQGIPTLIMFKDGREADRIVGAASKGVLQSRIDRVLNHS